MAQTGDKRSFRIVAAPQKRESVKNLLLAENFHFEQEPFSPFCQRLTSSEMPLGSSLAAFFGYVYIQDRSSMLPPLALAPDKGAFVIDVCASPGSKTSFLAQIVASDGFVMANEPNHERLATLKANIKKMNLFNVGFCNYDGQNLPFENYGCQWILLDPPCSGWGTFQKNPSALKIWKGDKINPLISLQRKLLEKCARFLAPGGRLLYSTCTTNPDENEKQAAFAVWQLGLQPLPIEPFPDFVFDSKELDNGRLLVNAQASKAQGFFLALFQKNGMPAKQEADKKIFFSKSDLPAFPLPGEGNARIFGSSVRYISAQAEKLPDNLSWQAPALGKYQSGSGFKPDSRLRYDALLGKEMPAIVFEEVAAIRELIAGKTIYSDIKNGYAELWWQDLPLGIVRTRNGRIINPFRQ